MMKNLEKAHFSFPPLPTLYTCPPVVYLLCMLIPQVYFFCKHKKLHTLVAAMTLQRLPGTEAMSAFEIP